MPTDRQVCPFHADESYVGIRLEDASYSFECDRARGHQPSRRRSRVARRDETTPQKHRLIAWPLPTQTAKLIGHPVIRRKNGSDTAHECAGAKHHPPTPIFLYSVVVRPGGPINWLAGSAGTTSRFTATCWCSTAPCPSRSAGSTATGSVC